MLNKLSEQQCRFRVLLFEDKHFAEQFFVLCFLRFEILLRLLQLGVVLVDPRVQVVLQICLVFRHTFVFLVHLLFFLVYVYLQLLNLLFIFFDDFLTEM